MLDFIVRFIVIGMTALVCFLFLRDGVRKYVGYNPSAPSLWARIKAWWPGFVKRHIVDDDPYDDESHAVARYYDKPTPEQIECASSAVKAGVDICDCRGSICNKGHNCPANEYCRTDRDRALRPRIALAWLKAHGLEP